MSQTIINGDSAEVLKQFESNTIDAVVTDPPYGIEFLGRDWDRNTGAIEIWQECLRVLKPGGHLLAFSAARTYHHLATNIESVGFEIRDQIMWIYSSGFPKAQDIGKAIDRRITKQKTDIKAEYNGGKHGPKNVDLGMQGVRCPVCKRDSNARYSCKEQECGMIYRAQTPEAEQWSGWKTALKPAHEPIVMARKPFRGSTMDCVLAHGVGALNIDATRIPSTPERIAEVRKINAEGGLVAGDGIEKYSTIGGPNKSLDKRSKLAESRYPSNVLGEVAGYQKFFYSPKVSRRERHRGFEDPGAVFPGSRFDISMPSKQTNPDTSMLAVEKRFANKKDPLAHIPTSKGGMLGTDGDWAPEHWHGEKGQKAKTTKSVGNNHPTVKPVELMKYLVRLVTPEGAHIIDPFSGSGSTGMACRELGRQFTGIDLDRNYCEIARKRIAATQEDKTETLFE